ncbi:MAG: VCBS repeat-containing protein [Rhodospirillaceae bacterium]|nr:VCBS repeat-containing protein [Rhodospirillaceae bacterium]
MIRLFFICLVAFAATAKADAPKLYKHQLQAPVAGLSATGSGLRLALKDGPVYMVGLAGSALKFSPARAVAPAKLGPNSLPDTVVATGSRGISAAWFIEPTRRYGHGVLGDAIEAGGLAARLSDGRVISISLDQHSVFEDRVPRLADMDGDGKDEILAVRSYLDRGAALTVIAPTKTRDALAIVGEAAAIGLSHRWLNPVGVGDFDGDGRIEAGVVITPHIGGTLQLYEWRGARLVPDHDTFGFSNHAMGSRELGLAAVADMNSDGVPDIILPDDTRRDLEVVTFKGGEAKTLFEISIGGRLAGPVAAADIDGDGRPEIAFVLTGDVLVIADPSP